MQKKQSCKWSDGSRHIVGVANFIVTSSPRDHPSRVFLKLSQMNCRIQDWFDLLLVNQFRMLTNLECLVVVSTGS